ncbi:MAG: protein TolR [Rhodobacteraceae bacterium]|nr:protein TolR [Paracoccaceae bacterium]
MAGGSVHKISQRTGGRRFSKRNGHKLMSEINVTPFVDVMLVLLIIFMVAAPLLTVGVEIELPKTAAKALPAEKESPLTLNLNKEKELILQESKIEFVQLIPKLRNIVKERKDDRIFLRADGQNDYAIVMQIMGALNKAGFNKISLVTESGGPTLN